MPEEIKGFDPDALQNSLEKQIRDAEALREAYASAASAASSIGSALMSIEDPTAKVAGLIAQALATIALGFADSLAKSKAGKMSVWGWIAEAAAGTATMISTIAAVKSATEYHADGGVIGGPRGTDITPMWGTPGEIVLNKAQQGNLASQLQGGVMKNARLETYIDGKALRVVLNNDGQYRGRGTLLTSK